MPWPFDDYDTMLPQLPALPGTPGVPSRQSEIPALRPEEADSLLHQLAGVGMGGLHFVGSSLDKAFGGRALRGILGGRPQELASIIPFSDTLGITNEANRVSGEDLLKQWGVLEGEGQKGTFEARDLAGPAVEAILDPGTYLTFGGSALSKAGQAAKKAGTLEKTLLGRIQSGQGGLAALHLPFTEATLPLGTGPTAERVASSLGQAAEAAKYGKIPGTQFSPGASLSALFDKTVEGTTDPLLQKALRSQAAEREARIAAEKMGLAESMQRIKAAGELPDDLAGQARLSDAMRAYMEGQPAILSPQAQAEAQMMRDRFAALPGEEQALGIPTPALPNYAPRQMTNYQAGKAGGGGRPQQPLSAFNVHQVGREEIFGDLPTATINQMARDAQVSGPNRALNQLQAEEHVGRQYLGFGPAEKQRMFDLNNLFQSGATMTPAELAERDMLVAKWKQSQGLADWLGRRDPQLAEKGLDFFGNNLYRDVETRLTRGVASQERAKAMHEAISKAAVPAGPGTVPLDQVLDSVGLTNPQGRAFLAQKMGIAPQDFFKYGVPQEIAGSLSKYVQGFTRPEAMNPFLQALDSMTAMFKAGVTAIWPAKYARDFAQGQYMNWVHDAYNPAYSALNPKAWLQPVMDAKTILRDGGVMKGAAEIPYFAGRGLTDEQATRELAALMHAHGIAGPEKLTGAVNATGPAAHSAEAAKAFNVPGSAHTGFGEALSDRNWNPLNFAGIGGRQATAFTPGRLGSEAMNWIDDINRGSAFIAKMQQGFVPEEAAKIVRMAQYDYGSMSQFEKSVMRRLMPFYSWTKNNIPAMVHQIVEKPGGKIGQSIKFTESMRHDQGFVPQNVGEGLAFRVGQEDETGRQRFLSNLGLPFEDAFSYLGTGSHAGARTIQNILADTTPYVKAPLEAAAGKQFSTGRNLDDLYGQLTGSQILDNILYNSPASRAITTARTIADFPRKGVSGELTNLLTPAKIHDVDMEKARGVAARDLISELLSGNPNVKKFEQLYVPKGQAANLTPEDLLLMRLSKTLEQRKKPQ